MNFYIIWVPKCHHVNPKAYGQTDTWYKMSTLLSKCLSYFIESKFFFNPFRFHKTCLKGANNPPIVIWYDECISTNQNVLLAQFLAMNLFYCLPFLYGQFIVALNVLLVAFPKGSEQIRFLPSVQTTWVNSNAIGQCIKLYLNWCPCAVKLQISANKCCLYRKLWTYYVHGNQIQLGYEKEKNV